MKKWTREELDASVKAYQHMLKLESEGQKFIKKRVYENLDKQYGRGVNSYERRMSNISYVYSTMGRRWVKGLKPLSNVGVNVISVIEELIQKNESKTGELRATFEQKVKQIRKKKPIAMPSGKRKPKHKESVSTAYERDPEVVAWLLENSKGICECCRKQAPFIKSGGTFYLEVHHLRRLADLGSDTIYNAIASCPNCHRELHYGQNGNSLLEELYSRIERLIPE